VIPAVEVVLAHGIGQVKDLPVPGWLFYYGAALVLVLSFVALGVLWTTPKLETSPERPLPEALQEAVLSRLVRALLGAASVALVVLVVAAGLVGKDSPVLNLAPTFVYVVFWLGIPFLTVLLGDVWRVLSPWRAIADAVAWVGNRLGAEWRAPLEYPDRLGRWPAAVLLFSFAALELAYTDPSSPRKVAIAACVYSWLTWTGAAAFGRDAWFSNGDGFSAYFGLFALMAPFRVRRGQGQREVVARPPVAGLSRLDARPGTIALVSVALGSVAFDGLSRTRWWQDHVHLKSDATVFALDLLGLGAAALFVAVTYLIAVAGARALGGARGALRTEFVGSLVPIAFAYLVAHYFSLFVLEGQNAIVLLSDPFGSGWDLLGTRDFVPDRTIDPRTIWYVQVGALVVGHVLGLVVAHDRALSLYRSARSAVRTQYAMLALMVLYTVGGMWILSRP
jgi:hypothetical protein